MIDKIYSLGSTTEALEYGTVGKVYEVFATKSYIHTVSGVAKSSPVRLSCDHLGLAMPNINFVFDVCLNPSTVPRRHFYLLYLRSQSC